MTWIVAGAGALLSIAGLYGLVTGASIIQVERGWATFIAGAVAVSAGVITLAIAALMARMERLVAAWTGAIVTRSEDDAETPAPPFRPVPPIFAPVVAEPQRDFFSEREAADFAAPLEAPASASSSSAASSSSSSSSAAAPAAPMFPELPPLRLEPIAEPASVGDDKNQSEAAPAEAVAEAQDERPAALRDFKFVFPPLEDEKPEEKVEPLKPVTDPSAGRFNLGWLRRNRQAEPEAISAPVPARVEPEPFIEPAPAPQAEPVVANLDAVETAPVERDTYRAPEPEIEPQQETMAAPDVVIAPETMSPISPMSPAPRVEPDKSPDPFSPDWLERALAGDDEKAPLSTAPRFVPPSQRRAQADEPAAPVPVVEPPPARPASAAPALSSEAVEIGRYSANDVSYIMYSDGSITAETATGTFRFGSLIELKDFIERGA